MNSSKWQSYRDQLIFAGGAEDPSSIGFLLDPSYMDLPEELLARMAPALSKALLAMRDLEAGAIANPDEGRMVGHYWLRDPERAPTPEIKDQIITTVERIKEFAQAVHSERLHGGSGPWRNLLVIGIGGSALGPQLVAQALSGADDRMQPFFFDNTDPDGFDRTLSQIRKTPSGLAGTVVIVISKSGGTKETRNGQLEVKAAFASAGLDFSRHAVAVTGEGSELCQTALREEWRAIFPMWDWVGGRTSELSAVGLLPAALQGIDIDGMLRGAREMDAITRCEGFHKNPAAMLSLCWYHAVSIGRRDMVILPYKDRLELFSRYLQQLVMESLGKERDLSGKVVHEGISVYGNKGSTDQHAYVQQLRDGVNNFFVTFVEVLRDRQAHPLPPDQSGRGPTSQSPFFVEEQVTSGDYLTGFLLGTRRALKDGGRLSLTLTVQEVSPRSLGMLIALYERAVGLYAQIVNINAYHQPGVEAGKKAAAAVLTLQHKLLGALSAEPKSALELSRKAGAEGDAVTAFKVLEHLASNQRIRRHAEGAAHPMDTKYSV